LNEVNHHRLGIDLGGTKIEGILLDRSGRIRNRYRIPTPAGDYDAILDAISDVTAFLSEDESLPVGIGTPGSTSRNSPLMRNSNSTCLNGRNLLADLEQKLNRQVRLANDANCFTLSEATDGAAAKAGCVFGVILGTGVGGGICANGRLLEGINGIAGEWGHNYLNLEADNLPGRQCFCGKCDCNETWLSGPGLSKTYQALSGNSHSAHEIVQLATSGNSDAITTLNNYYTLLSRALAMVINIVDPEVVVFGGGLSNIPGLCDELSKRLPGEVFSDQIATRLMIARYGDSSGVRGAAWLWP
jgi:predicted NBD/HSP70 family sugar kinase